MRTVWLSLCAGLVFAAMPCRAQQPADEPAAPLLLVYVAKSDDNVLPRIALGIEKPALKITAFEKCVRISTTNPQFPGIAAQLKAEDTKTLVAAIKALGAPDARELPTVVIWFATPDAKGLNYLSTGGNGGTEANLIKGVLLFDPRYEEPVARYLNEKLHPE